jgi:predicted metalloendopeptidase
MALLDTIGSKTVASIDGFTPTSASSSAGARCGARKRAPESSRMLAQVDPHSPGRYRVNGVVSNLPEFADAFGCKAGAPMVREPMCRVW